MKKLIVTAVSAICGLALNAATYTWHVDYVLMDMTSGIKDGSVVYAFADQNLANQMVSALSSETYTDWSDFSAKVFDGTTKFSADGTTSEGYTTGSISIPNSSKTSPAFDTMSLLVLEGTENGSKLYVATADAEALADYLYYDNNVADQYYIWEATSAGTIAYGGGDVPEPTSAMLLLLGMAGLALRRRHA